MTILRYFLILLLTLGQAPTVSAQNQFNLDSAKYGFKWKKRRIMFNNDGGDIQLVFKKDTSSTDSFLRRRFDGLRNSQVDAVSYCDGFFSAYAHYSQVTEVRRKGVNGDYIVDFLVRNGTDPLQQAISFCRKNSLDIFWSIRVNDSHDSQNYQQMPLWKHVNRNALMGNEQSKFDHLNVWTALNYENYKVRRQLLTIVEDVISRYDVDGIELDFFKHLMLFRETLNGKQAKNHQVELMSGLIHDIRQLLDEYAIKKSKALLLIIRVPDSFEYNLELGIDLEHWLGRNYIDILVTSGYFKLNSYEFLAKVGKTFDVPVYACILPRRIHQGGGPADKTDLKKWRGEAYSALKAGVDGIYVYNRFSANDQILDEIGTLEVLEKLEMEENFESFVCETCWFKPQRWIKGGNQFIKTGDKYLEEIISKKKFN